MWEQEREQKPPVYKLDNLAVGLTQLRNENILCDLLIHLNDGSTVWAHKAVVCAVSPYILQLCQAEQSKSQSMMYINLNHINVTNESLHLIVNYMYGCEIVVSSENLQDMRALANVLQLEDLKESLSENFNVEDHDEATQHEKALAYNEASGLSTSIKVEPCEDIQDTSNNIISLSPNIERDYNKNNSTNHTDFDIKLNDADDMDDAEADDYDDTVGDIETPTKRRKKSITRERKLSRAEIQKNYRERQKAKGPEYLQKERSRMRRNYVPIRHLSAAARKKRRKKNLENLRKYRRKKALQHKEVVIKGEIKQENVQ